MEGSNDDGKITGKLQIIEEGKSGESGKKTKNFASMHAPVDNSAHA